MIENNGGHAAPVEIARELFRELHSVTGMLKRMEEAGLVTKHKGSGRSKVEVRSRVLKDLGIPEWQLSLSLNRGSADG